MNDGISLLNLGCGDRYHPKWVNVDIAPIDESIIQYDLSQGLPFSDGKYDTVYNSHLLEHFTRHEARFFISECCRVLKPGGIIRVVVPDLEKIAQLYLKALEMGLHGDVKWEARYDWMMLELYDQTVRESSGGEMSACLSQSDFVDREFVINRVGKKAEHTFTKSAVEDDSNQERKKSNNKLLKYKRTLCRMIRDSEYRREQYLRVLLGDAFEYLKIGRFRRSGEIHLWMYDRFSLSRLLIEVGFNNPQQVSPIESFIPNWVDYHLDTDPDGRICKPDSLYMEAKKL